MPGVSATAARAAAPLCPRRARGGLERRNGLRRVQVRLASVRSTFRRAGERLPAAIDEAPEDAPPARRHRREEGVMRLLHVQLQQARRWQHAAAAAARVAVRRAVVRVQRCRCCKRGATARRGARERQLRRRRGRMSRLRPAAGARGSAARCGRRLRGGTRKHSMRQQSTAQEAKGTRCVSSSSAATGPGSHQISQHLPKHKRSLHWRRTGPHGASV